MFRFSIWRHAAILDFVVANNAMRGRCALSMTVSKPNLVKITQIGAELWIFSIFQNGWRPPSWILLQVQSDFTTRCGLSFSTSMPNLVTISQIMTELLRFDVFQYGGRPPSWILL